jgi:hypothetical protein
MACLDVNCTTPPPSTCTGLVATSYTSPGACDFSGSCVYLPSSITCANGCVLGACAANPFVSVGGTSARRADDGSPVTLAVTTANGASTGGGPVPAGVGVTVTATTTPGGTTIGVTVVCSLVPDFSSGVVFNTMTSTAVSGTSETWTGTMPPAPAGSEVYFYVHATPYVAPTDTSTEYDPSTFGVHYAYAVQ